MAQRADAFRSGRFYLPTINLTDPTTSFGNITPAFNNNYDVGENGFNYIPTSKPLA